MSITNKLIIIVLSVILVFAFAFYYYFPTLVNPLSTDIILTLLIFTFFSLLTYGSIKAETKVEIYLFLSIIVICGILARSIPHLRFVHMSLWDPYYYSIPALNIAQNGTLQPILINWYSMVRIGLCWPMLSSNTVTLAQITNININWFFQYQEPLLGAAYTLGIFLLAKEVTRNNKIALISALLATIAEDVVFYQSEYHPQGLAFIFFAFFLWSYIKSINNSRGVYKCIALIFLVGLLLSHDFSSIFISFLALSIIIFSMLVFVLPRTKLFNIIKQAGAIMRKDFIFLALIALIGFAYHFFGYDALIQTFLIRLTETQSPSVVWTTAIKAPFLTVFLNYAKWGILLLASLTIIRIIRSPNENEIRLLVLLSGILAAGLVGSFIAGAPLDRFIAFYVPEISMFAAMTIFSCFTYYGTRTFFKFPLVQIGIPLVIGILLSMQFFNAQIPAFYFKSSSINPYYWYSNDLSSLNLYGLTGQWIKNYTPKDAKYVGDWGDCMIPFYYAERPDQNVSLIKDSQTYPGSYIVLNPNVPSCQYEGQLDKEQFLETIDTVYSNGTIEVGKIPP